MALTPDQLSEFQAFAEKLADAAAAAIRPHFRTQIATENKSHSEFDPVTVADTAAEEAMRELIHAHYPSHGILGEEGGTHTGESPFTWVLDPIDGTRAFITGLPLWGTLIALNDGTQPILGVMNQPFTGERYIGSLHGAWLNGTRLKTRPCTSLTSARLMCTTPEMFNKLEYKEVFDTVAKQVQLLRFGGDCYAYCMLASGFVDVIIEAGLQPYDVQALIPIVEAAGGRLTRWDGSSAQDGGAVIACGDPELHYQLLELMSGVRAV